MKTKALKRLLKDVFYSIPSSSILMFHHIGVPESDRISSCNLSKEVFESICKNFSDISRSVDDVLIHNGYVAFTFDDGFEDFYYNAFPILQQYRIPFVLFVVEDFIGEKGYLSKSQLKTILDSPLCEIGSHGKTHKILSKLTTEELVDEIVQSRINIESLLGCKITKMAYSHGNADTRCLKMVRVYDTAYFANSMPLNFITRLSKFKYPRLNMTDKTYAEYVRFVQKYL